jgi:hypothetical protein
MHLRQVPAIHEITKNSVASTLDKRKQRVEEAKQSKQIDDHFNVLEA